MVRQVAAVRIGTTMLSGTRIGRCRQKSGVALYEDQPCEAGLESGHGSIVERNKDRELPPQ
eukprot:4703058-Pleurochrysis_carterae.AAC.1